MALHSTLPIYKATYQLLVLATEITRNMPRDFKASMGTKIREECLELVVLIYRANAAADKVPHLSRLLERLQVAELLFRLSKDLRLIAVKQHAAAMELTQAIGKQANGWRKSSAASSPVA
jgi:hypothetical protein